MDASLWITLVPIPVVVSVMPSNLLTKIKKGIPSVPLLAGKRAGVSPEEIPFNSLPAQASLWDYFNPITGLSQPLFCFFSLFFQGLRTAGLTHFRMKVVAYNPKTVLFQNFLV
jgi:hypothetical protein